ncbi:MAG: ATP-binding protein [Candidatus Kapabacteria bacterium]|jgi:PAS domain S-box-containing protein|nr:ATP-binding protein [Candidatus Kapabacteria bacterium]
MITSIDSSVIFGVIDHVEGLGLFEYNTSTGALYLSQGWRNIFDVESDAELTIGETLQFYNEPYRSLLRKEANERASNPNAPINFHPFTLEAAITTARQNQRWVRMYRQLAQADGIVISRGFVQDITTEIAQRALREEYQSLYDNAPCGYFSVTRDGTILRINNTLLDYLGYRREEIIGKKSITNLITQSSEAIREQLVKILDNGGDDNFGELEFIRRDSTTFWCMVTSKPVYEQGTETILYANVTVIDLTDRKELEAARKHQEFVLESSRIKTEFLNILAHEFRTPLGIIVSASDVLEDFIAAGGEEFFHLLKSGTERLTVLLNNIITLAKIEFDSEGVITEGRTNVRNAVRTIISEYSPHAYHKGLELRLVIASDVPTEVILDSLQVVRVASLLLDNAIKFTDSGSVTLTVDIVREPVTRLPFLRFSFADTGIGIDEKELELIFRPFFQSERGITRSFEGTGIGLTIARHLVRKMGGRLTVESTLGQGTTAAFTIPLQEEVLLNT